MNNFSTRLKKYIDSLGLSINSFASILGHKSGTTIANAVAGRNSPRVSLLEEIFKEFPNVNFDWLVTGRGAMHVDGSIVDILVKGLPPKEATLNKESEFYDSKKPKDKSAGQIALNIALETIEEQKETIKDLREDKAFLKEQFNNFKKGASNAPTGT